MDNSLLNTELSGSIVKIDSRPGSDKSDNFEELDIDSSTDSNGKHDDLQQSLADVADVDAVQEAPVGSSIRNAKTLQDLENNLPETVSILTHPETGAVIYLVGTAHFSQESKDDVAKVIQMVQPNIVILELCEARTGIITLDEATILEEVANIGLDTIRKTIAKNGLYCGITYLLLLNLSAYFTKEMGMAPGGEFRVAFKEASRIPNCIVKLGDRPIKITLSRALAKLSWWQSCKLAWNLLFTKDPISKEEVERCKRQDLLEQLLADLAGEYPILSKVFVDERDIILTYSLQQAAKTDPKSIAGPGHTEPLKIVGVVGIGHALGIAKLFPVDQTPHVRQVLIIPPQTLASKIIKTTFKLLFFTAGGYLVYRYLPLPRIVRRTANQAFIKMVDTIKIH